MSDEPKAKTPGGAASDETGEATVAIPATPVSDEPTAAITDDEATIAIPDDEATVAIPADEKTVTFAAEPPPESPADEAETDEADEAEESGVDADEKTIAMVATPVADEATTVLPTRAPAPSAADEQTTVISSPAPADEKTTVLPAASADEATVAMSAREILAKVPKRSATTPPAPPEDRTVAIPTPPIPTPPAPAPATPPAAPARRVGGAITRRRLLLGAGGAALAAGAIAVYSASGESEKDTAKPISGSPVATTKPRTPESTTVAPSPIPVQRKPISTLAEYAKAAGATPFPADAVALTIDDGPHPIWTPKILKLLDKYQIPAMFCMIGNQVLGHEAVAQMVTTSGHQLANHTWSHPTKLGKKSSSVVQKEIKKAQSKISKTTGYEPKLFRSPGGDWSPQLLKDIAHAGLLPLDWSNDPRDWTQPGAAKIEQRMLAAKPGQILLCHDGGGDRSQTYQALSKVIPALAARGLKFVAL